MPILLKMNLACNFRCKYCYEKPILSEKQVIDHEKVEATIRRLWKKQGGEGKDGKPRLNERGKYCGPTITLHGGEPTIMSKEDFERYLKLSFELTGKSGIQTNGYLIDDDMIELFKKYKTHVGVSIDGPWPLNELRGIGKKKQRKMQTEKILKTLYKLKDKGIGCSVIAVIHKKNALGERREVLKRWVKELTKKGITGRLNPCCCGDTNIDLTPLEAAEAYVDLYEFMLREGISQWSPLRDMISAIKGESQVVCVFRNCDPFCTNSATSVLHDGSVGVCLRLYGDGKKYLRAEKASQMRSEVLRQTDCKGCKWWDCCYGGCSGLSKDWDWRNKDRYCEMYKALFERIENTLRATRTLPSKQKGPLRRRRGGGDHCDGIEHADGDGVHLDSNNPCGATSRPDNHTDGSRHLDGNTIHLDSGDLIRTNHADGITHVDGAKKHLDSGD